MSSTEANKYKIKWDIFRLACKHLAIKIKKTGRKYKYIYPIPKNGLYVAEYLSNYLNITLCLDLNVAVEEDYDKILFVDDLIDSGRTLNKFPRRFDRAVLFVKNNNEDSVNYYVKKINKWIVFPWEKENDIEDTIIRQLEYIGEDPTREGLLATPKRVVDSWKELYSGYRIDKNNIFTVFEDGACDEMVILKDCEFYSTCEHHLLPFYGKINIGYIPNGKVIGISKLARLVEVFSRRLQIQEKMTAQIADEIIGKLEATGVMVTCEAQHFCMTSRGIKKQSSKMITSAIRGVFKDDSIVRQEFLNLIK